NEGNFAADVKYSAGGVEAFVAAYDDGDISDYTATKVGGQFKSGPHKISGQYEMIDTGTNEPTVLFLGYQMKMGKNTFALQYADADPDVNGVDNTTYVALGVIHKFSKMTRLFAGYRDTSDIESVVTVGLRKDFK
ncbi:MAG TPA: porin, partial [Gammaproteobacteria bacterium]|nr:porin [Gammaproteobacteria bacterium]